MPFPLKDSRLNVVKYEGLRDWSEVVVVGVSEWVT